ncbi:tyrosine-type recombinase/integrase [Thiomicrorhabdus cannonii]|uniref:tyrosine-type recombinase/integrase n=1 Tax=Thiomicrorhabdus cannonii TaxID=2748011 RepID=UPI0015BF38C7|nr:integrase arm-type DNA-binding domain-containing protein [Thiomicrorhabdus cannonii]
MKRNLTDIAVKKLKPLDKAYKTTDGGGLYILTTPTGTKTWRYDCSINGKRATLTFGEYPTLSLADARKQHEETKAQIKSGIDPRKAEQVDEHLSLPFSHYALEMMKTQELRDSTYAKKLNRMKKHLFPVLDKMPVTKITSIDLLNLIKPIAVHGKRETAQLLATYCRQTFDTLMSLQLIQINPAESISRLIPKPKQSQNFAHITSPQEFASLLIGIDNYHGDFAVKKALQLAPLVILRPHNIRFLKWRYVNFRDKLITIPAYEMKMNRDHKIPLSRQALAILEEMHQATSDKELVFISSRSKNDKEMSENTLNQAVIRIKDPITGEPLGRGTMTSHGFRHTASTLLNELKFSADAIELQLAHVNKDRIRATYNKAELMEERTEMMQKWADYLDSLKKIQNI